MEPRSFVIFLNTFLRHKTELNESDTEMVKRLLDDIFEHEPLQEVESKPDTPTLRPSNRRTFGGSGIVRKC